MTPHRAADRPGRSRAASPAWRLPRDAAVVTLLYAIAGTTWILLSDSVVEWVFSDISALAFAQTVKGILYVGGTAGLLHHFARRARRRAEIDRDWYRGLFRSDTDAVFVIDRAGRFVEVNDTAVERYGRTREELLGMGPADLVAPGARTILGHRLHEALERPLRFRSRHRVDGGNDLDVEVSTRPVHRGGDWCVVVAVREVDPAQRTDEELAEHERRFDTLLENVPGVVYRCRIDHDWTMELVSEEVRALTGYAPDDLCENARVAYGDLIHPDDRQRVWEEVSAAAARGDSFVLKYRIIDAQGCERWVWERGRTVPGPGPGGKRRIEGFLLDVTERRRAREALRRSDALRARIERIARFGTWEWSVATDTVRWSEGLYEIFGLDPSSAPPPFAIHDELYVAEDMVRLEAAVEAALTEARPYELELRARRADGEIRWCVSRGEPEVGPDGTVVRLFGSLHDVTDRRRADQALHESEQRFRSFVEHAPDAIFVQVDGRFAFANPATARLLGAASPDDLIGVPVLERVFPDDRDQVAERIRTLNEDLRAVDLVEERMMGLDGTVRWVEASATPLRHDGRPGALVFQRDIGERRQREAERERLLRAVEQAGDAILVSAPDGTIEYVNPAFERLTGHPRDEAIGRNPRILKSGEHDEAFHRDLWETITAGRTWQGRIVNRRRDGTRYVADATIAPVRDAEGTVVDFVGVQRDVTRELDLEHQLAQARKMESIGRLAGGIAHDFNNMLTVILGNLEIVLAATPEDAPSFADLRQVREAALRSAGLVGQLLTFARQQVIAPRALDLDAAVEDRLGMLRRLIGEDIDLRWRPAGDLWRVHVDPAQVDQILTNLLVNARDAIEGVGRVTIETANVVLDEAYCAEHAGFKPGEHVMLAVSDTGAGMDRETLARVFEPFYTTKSDNGTGLGLATVYGIVRQNDGFVNAYSEPGEGSAFRVYLPRKAEAERLDVEEPVRQPDVGGSDTILVVEDNDQVFDLVTRQLESLGYAVLAAAGPEEALRLVDRHEGRIDLLLTDVVMPVMHGPELGRRLAEARPGLKCLYMSGYTGGAVVHRGALEENLHFLQKPFSLRDLSAAVRAALDAAE